MLYDCDLRSCCLLSLQLQILSSASRCSASCERACSLPATKRLRYLWATVTHPVPCIREEQARGRHLFSQPGPNDVWVERAQLGARCRSSILLKRVSKVSCWMWGHSWIWTAQLSWVVLDLRTPAASQSLWLSYFYCLRAAASLCGWMWEDSFIFSHIYSIFYSTNSHTGYILSQYNTLILSYLKLIFFPSLHCCKCAFSVCSIMSSHLSHCHSMSLVIGIFVCYAETAVSLQQADCCQIYSDFKCAYWKLGDVSLILCLQSILLKLLFYR